MSMSASAATKVVAAATNPAAPAQASAQAGDVQWPTETEIYILPDGRVVVADLPAELNGLADALGVAEPCEIAPDAQPDTPL